MRVIAGKAKGRVLKVPREVSRPTTDRVRESIFGILGELVLDAEVLDLYAGSGALGIEALSRGARSCVFVEQNRGAVRTIQDNLKKTKLEEAQVVTRDVTAHLRGSKDRYDLIFADPPYADGLRDGAADLVTLSGWRDWLKDEGLLIFEREAVGEVPPMEGLEILQQRDYGRSRIVIYRQNS